MPAARRASARSTAASWALEILAEALVELVLVEVGSEVPGILVVAGLSIILVRCVAERTLDPGPLGLEQLACALGIHAASLRRRTSEAS